VDLCLLAESTGFLEWTWVILQVAIGLGFVIFVHELGHFAVAKMCGVQCDKFYVGFDVPIVLPFVGKLVNGFLALLARAGLNLPRVPDPIRLPSSLWKKKWGETVYGIGVIPLGGYVKMLGQEDNPARAAEEMRRARVYKDQKENGAEGHASELQSAAGKVGMEARDEGQAATSAGERAESSPSGAAEEYTLDPRSYLAQPVWQRLAIISAGVVMNVIFAFIFAVIAYSMGVKYYPCVVSDVVPGSPAWRANIQLGDEIVKVEDTAKPRFRDLRVSVSLSDAEQGVPMVIDRPGRDEHVKLRLEPEKNGGDLLTIGILQARSLTLYSEAPAAPGSPADRAGFEGSDEIVAVDGEEVSSYAEFARIAALKVDQPLEITVRRGGERARSNAPGKSSGGELVKLTVDPHAMERLGLVMEMGKITAIQKDSPADAAGLQPEDFIAKIDGSDVSDPVNLPEYARQKALAAETMVLTVRRPGEKDPLEIAVEPRVPQRYESAMTGTPMAAPALGIAYHITSRVKLVQADSPAQKAGVLPEDFITSATFIPAPGDESRQAEYLAKETIKFGKDNPNWPGLMSVLQNLPPGMKVKLTVERDEEELQFELGTYHPVYEEGVVRRVFEPDRGFQFAALEYIRQAKTFGEAVWLGWRETKESLLMVYRFLLKLWERQIPLKALGGPLTIAQGAGYHAFEGLPSLLIFLTMLSANLAVLNFLPIPVLDGGHAVFLLYEGILRRPVSERFFNFLNMIGLLFLLCLMAFVLSLDVGRFFFDAFQLK